MKRSFIIIFLLGFVICFANANVKLPRLFSDNLVLQREMRVPVWGWADPGEKVVIELGGHVAETVANSDGKWKLCLGLLDAGGPFELIISGKNSITVKNVLVGEVWVCSGQSNMAMEVQSCLNAKQEIASANYPQIRYFQVKRTKALKPLDDVSQVENEQANWLNTWEVCNPSTVMHFTAAGYFFGLNLHKKLNIPVGLISASWGGTTAEAWTPQDTLENDPELNSILKNWPDYNNDEEWLKTEYENFVKEVEKARKLGQTEPLYFNQPSVLYNGIIAPIIPYGIRGVIWYQGESNTYRAYQYRSLFPAMIQQWRKKWKEGDFPFLFVQLANYYFEPQVFPELREAQTMALSLPNTAMVVTIDIGDSADIHPINKQEVGRRLFIAAEKLVYGEDLIFSGPFFKSMIIEGDKCRLSFTCVGDGLIAKGSVKLKGFIIASTNKKFVDAQAKIEGSQVLVWNENIPHPVAVRYAWANHPGGCNLYNIIAQEVNLPASPFRTDDWPGITFNRASSLPVNHSQVSPENTTIKDSLDKLTNKELSFDSTNSSQVNSESSASHFNLDELNRNELYSFSKDIINGPKWVYVKKYRGSPFLMTAYWPTANIQYKGVMYSGIQMNFDLYNNKLIISVPSDQTERFVVLSRDFLDGFSYTDTISKKKHLFKYFELPGTKGKGLYEKTIEGKTSLFIKPGVNITGSGSDGYSAEYISYYDYFIRTGTGFQQFSSKKALFEILGNHTKELRKFIRKNRLKVDKRHPDNLISILHYYNELN